MNDQIPLVGRPSLDPGTFESTLGPWINFLEVMHNSKMVLLDRERVVPLLGPAGSEDPALFNGDGQVVDACFSTFHVTLGVEFPQLVSVASPPLANLVMPFVLEPDGYPVILKRPEVFAQCVILLTLPFGDEELDDCGSAPDEFRSDPK